jgi:hypothetical protein
VSLALDQQRDNIRQAIIELPGQCADRFGFVPNDLPGPGDNFRL